MLKLSIMNTSSPVTSRLLAARLTPRGRGAVATIAVHGPCERLDQATSAVFRAANGRLLAAQPLNQVVFGHWGTEQPQPPEVTDHTAEAGGTSPVAHGTGEEVVVCRTDESTFEIHCHGGDAAVTRVLADLNRLGFETVDWPALLEETVGVVQAECRQATARGETLRAAEWLLEQESGLLEAEFHRLIELAEYAPASESAGSPEDAAARYRLLRDAIENLCAWSTFGLRLTQGWQVVLGGRPNAGKSSLMNALLGFSRAIVSAQPGTTRDSIGHGAAFDGWPVQLHDTAGLRQTVEPLEAAGIERAARLFSTADARLLLLDHSNPLADDDEQLLADWPDAIVVKTKCDLPTGWDAATCRTVSVREPVEVSAISGAGLPELMARVVRLLVPAEPAPGTAFPVSARQVELLEQARQLLPPESVHLVTACSREVSPLLRCLRELAGHRN